MSESINFARNRWKLVTAHVQMDLRLLKYSAGALGFSLLVLSIAALAGLGLTWQLQQTKSRQEELRRAVLLQEDVERSYVIFINKLSTLSKLLGTRSDKQAAIAFFNGRLGEKILVNDISYLAEEGVLNLTLQAPDIFAMDEVFTLLDSPTVKTAYPTINKSELKRTAQGQYLMTITVVLPKDDKKAKPAAAPQGTTP
jgi:hypothetical protein